MRFLFFALITAVACMALVTARSEQAQGQTGTPTDTRWVFEHVNPTNSAAIIAIWNAVTPTSRRMRALTGRITTSS